MLTVCSLIINLSEAKEKKIKKIPREIIMEAIEIIGKIEKPQAMYIIPRAKSKYEEMALERNFIKEYLIPFDISKQRRR
jgi:hypothetical protein